MCCFPEIRWRPKKKKRSSSIIEVFFCFFSRNQVKTIRKMSAPQLGLYSAGRCRIYSYWLALFRLIIIQRSNLDGETPKYRWEDAYPLHFKYCLQAPEWRYQPIHLWLFGLFGEIIKWKKTFYILGDININIIGTNHLSPQAEKYLETITSNGPFPSLQNLLGSRTN